MDEMILHNGDFSLLNSEASSDPTDADDYGDATYDIDLGDDFDLYGDGADDALALMVDTWDGEFDALNDAEEMTGAAYPVLTLKYPSTIAMFSTAIEGSLSCSANPGERTFRGDKVGTPEYAVEGSESQFHDVDTVEVGTDKDSKSSGLPTNFDDLTDDFDLDADFDLYGDGADDALALMVGEWDDEYDALNDEEARQGGAYATLTTNYPSTVSMFANSFAIYPHVDAGQADALSVDESTPTAQSDDDESAYPHSPSEFPGCRWLVCKLTTTGGPDEFFRNPPNNDPVPPDSDSDSGDDCSEMPTGTILQLVSESLAKQLSEPSFTDADGTVMSPLLRRAPRVSLSSVEDEAASSLW